MKKILYIYVAIMLLPITALAQWDASKEYYIQTKEGLCLSNQETNDQLALIRFAEPNEANPTQKWKLQPAENGYLIVNVSSGKSIDNIGTAVLNLFQMNALPDSASQQWKLVPVEGKTGYYSIVSVNFQKNWSTNYNQAVSLAVPSIYKTAQWYRINETIQTPDNVTQPDPEPIVTAGTQKIKFSTAESPVWYKMNPYYASSATVNKNNVIAYFEAGNNRWIVKGASNTKIDNASFDDPEVSLWRFEGSESNFYLINKGTGLKLAYPATNATQQRFLLNAAGSAFVIRKSNTLDPAMQPDAHYIDPLDAAVLANGRINADGATAELILYKNGTADVTAGKGSTFIFIETPMKSVSVTSNNADWGVAKIRKDKKATSYVNGAFVFTESADFETTQTVTRAQKNSIGLFAEPLGSASFKNWTDAVNSSVLNTSASFNYAMSADLNAQAVFESGTGARNQKSGGIKISMTNDKSRILAPEYVKSITIIDIAGKCQQSVQSNEAGISALVPGVYLVKLTTDNKEFIVKMVK